MAADQPGGQEPRFEEAMARLEAIVHALEAGDLSLDDSLRAFEEGTGLLRYCARRLEETERRIEILPDTGHRDRIAPAEWQEVVARMRPRLAAGRHADALLEGLAALQDLLVGKGCRRGVGDDGGGLPNRPIDEPGVRS